MNVGEEVLDLHDDDVLVGEDTLVDGRVVQGVSARVDDDPIVVVGVVLAEAGTGPGQ